MTGPMNTENILPTSSLPVTTYRKITSQWTITLLHVSSSLGFRQQFYHRWNHVPRQKKNLKNSGRLLIEKEGLFYTHITRKKKLMLVCCINKKKSGKKTMIVLSTMHENGKVKKDQRKKPQLHTIYNYTKGGVDAADLLSANHSTRIKSMR